MKCPKCNKEINYVNFTISINPCTGIIKIDKHGKLSDVPDFYMDDDTSRGHGDPVFKCPKCYKDITEYIPNADEFEDFANQI